MVKRLTNNNDSHFQKIIEECKQVNDFCISDDYMLLSEYVKGFRNPIISLVSIDPSGNLKEKIKVGEGYEKLALFKDKKNNPVIFLSDPVPKLRSKIPSRVAFRMKDNKIIDFKNNDYSPRDTTNKFLSEHSLQGRVGGGKNSYRFLDIGNVFFYNTRNITRAAGVLGVGDKKNSLLKIQRKIKDVKYVEEIKLPVKSRDVILLPSNPLRPEDQDHYSIEAVQLLRNGNDIVVKKGTIFLGTTRQRYAEEGEKEYVIKGGLTSDNDEVFFRYDKKRNDYVIKIRRDGEIRPIIFPYTMIEIANKVNSGSAQYLLSAEEFEQLKDRGRKKHKKTTTVSKESTTTQNPVSLEPQGLLRKRRGALSFGKERGPVGVESPTNKNYSISGSAGFAPSTKYGFTNPNFKENKTSAYGVPTTTFSSLTHTLESIPLFGLLFVKATGLENNKNTQGGGSLLARKIQQDTDAYSFTQDVQSMWDGFHSNNHVDNSMREKWKKGRMKKEEDQLRDGVQNFTEENKTTPGLIEKVGNSIGTVVGHLKNITGGALDLVFNRAPVVDANLTTNDLDSEFVESNKTKDEERDFVEKEDFVSDEILSETIKEEKDFVVDESVSEPIKKLDLSDILTTGLVSTIGTDSGYESEKTIDDVQDLVLRQESEMKNVEEGYAIDDVVIEKNKDMPTVNLTDIAFEKTFMKEERQQEIAL